MAHGGDFKVDAELLARDLMQMRAGAARAGVREEQHRAMAATYRISRVPSHLRDNLADAWAYTPGFASIGPLHWRSRGPSNIRLKAAYLHSLILRGHPDPTHHLAIIQEYVGIIAAREQEARALYVTEDVADLDANDFVKMMVLDGCFIIEHLVNVTLRREEPSLHATPSNPTQLSVDLILAENQIPFFVLVDLISSTKLPEFEDTGYAPPVLLVKLVLYYLAGDKGRDMSDALPAAKDVYHILHLLHAMITTARTMWAPPSRIQAGTFLEMAQEAGRLLCCLPRRLPLLLLVPLLYRILPREHAREDVPSASDLKRMSVEFKKPRGGSRSNTVTGIASVMGPVPLAMTLTHENRLQLPQLRVESRTMPLLLNLMAFEQSTAAPSGSQQDVSAYASFMAKMVRSVEDAGVLAAAEVLHVDGIIVRATMEWVARFFHEMGAASAAAGNLYTSYLGVTLEALMQRVPRWSNVRTDYFTLLAELVALVTFISGVSTIAQTYATFKYH